MDLNATSIPQQFNGFTLLTFFIVRRKTLSNKVEYPLNVFIAIIYNKASS